MSYPIPTEEQLSKIETRLATPSEGVDQHEETAKLLFKTAVVTPEQRAYGKKVNFMVVYSVRDTKK